MKSLEVPMLWPREHQACVWLNPIVVTPCMGQLHGFRSSSHLLQYSASSRVFEMGCDASSGTLTFAPAQGGCATGTRYRNEVVCSQSCQPCLARKGFADSP